MHNSATVSSWCGLPEIIVIFEAKSGWECPFGTEQNHNNMFIVHFFFFLSISDWASLGNGKTVRLVEIDSKMHVLEA